MRRVQWTPIASVSRPGINWIFRCAVLFIAILVFLTALRTPAFAQSTATLEGVVKDPTGAVLPNAQITVKQKATDLSRSVLSNGGGYYRASNLPVGAYDVQVSVAGFKKKLIQGLELRIDQVANLDIVMDVGEVSQEIMVQGIAPLVDSTTTSVGGVVENVQIMALPLNGRHFLQLGLLIPGVNQPQAGSTQSQWGAAGGNVGFSVSGQRDSYNNFTLDGVNVMDTNYNTVVVSPSVDAVQEFKIIANGYSAKYGIVPGAQVDIITRSGTNSTHGSVFEFLRNSAVDAKNYFDRSDRSIPPYKQNQFGGTIGGPIEKNRFFYFLSYEGLRIRQSLTQTTTVPTLDMHMGDLSGINPGTGLPFPQITDVNGVPFTGNMIPTAAINPMAAAILALTPLPNVPNAAPGQSNYIAVGQRYVNSDQFLGRLDYQWTAKHLASVRYIQQHDSSSSPFVARFSPVLPSPQGFGDKSDEMGRNIEFSLISTLTPSVVNAFHFGNNSLNAIVKSENADSHFLEHLNIPRFGETLQFGIPFVSIPGLGVLGDSDTLQPNIRRNNGFQFRDDITWTHGRFTHEFGADYWRYYLNGVTDTFSNGSFNFGDERLGFGQTVTGAGFSDFLLDRPRFSLVQLGVGFGSYRYNYLGAYYAGQFRATPNLVLQYGLRWEVSTTPTPIDGTITSMLDLPKGNIVLASQSGEMPSLSDPLTQYFINTFGTSFATNRQLGLPASTDPTDHKMFAPRVGFAWDVHGDQRLVVRSSFGIFNNFQERGYNVQSGVLGPPFAPTIGTFQDSIFFPTTPNTYESTFAFGGPPDRTEDNGGPSTGGVPPGVRPGYLPQWNFSVQSELARNLALELSYTGSHGSHINGFILNDQNFPNTPTARGGFPPDPRFGESFQEHSFGQTWYHGFSAQLRQRVTHGVSFTAGYTWAKAEDTVSTFTGGPTDSPVPQNSYDIAGNKGLSNFDVRHRFVFNYVWDLPFGKGKAYLNQSKIADAILGGWQAGGLLTVTSGQPFTVQLTGNVSGIASSSADRPNCVSDPNTGAPHSVHEWFDINAFAPNTVIFPSVGFPYRLLGNCGRNIVEGPPLRDYDMSLSKRFSMGDRASLEFRAESFNLFNHPNFNIPNRYFGSATFGSITSAQFPRLMQFGLRLSF